MPDPVIYRVKKFARKCPTNSDKYNCLIVIVAFDGFFAFYPNRPSY